METLFAEAPNVVRILGHILRVSVRIGLQLLLGTIAGVR